MRPSPHGAPAASLLIASSSSSGSRPRCPPGPPIARDSRRRFSLATLCRLSRSTLERSALSPCFLAPLAAPDPVFMSRALSGAVPEDGVPLASSCACACVCRRFEGGVEGVWGRGRGRVEHKGAAGVSAPHAQRPAIFVLSSRAWGRWRAAMHRAKGGLSSRRAAPRPRPWRQRAEWASRTSLLPACRVRLATPPFSLDPVAVRLASCHSRSSCSRDFGVAAGAGDGAGSSIARPRDGGAAAVRRAVRAPPSPATR